MITKDDLEKAAPCFYSFLVMTSELDRFCRAYAHRGTAFFRIKKPEQFVDSAFLWKDSIEGFAYWSAIDRQWRAICETD